MDNSCIKRALTEIEASNYIGMSRSFLRQSRMDGQRENRTPAPPFIKIGRSVRYLLEDLDNWLDNFHRLEHLGQAHG
jgi:predicted DNA-binding transcriptional regulator AlpA